MGVTQALLRFGYVSPRALLVVPPGGTDARLEVERCLRNQGGSLAAGPADADTLVLCGRVSGGIQSAADRVFQQMPAPRTRVFVTDPLRADEALGSATQALQDMAIQQAQAEQTEDVGVQRRMSEGHGHSHHGSDEDDGGEGMMMPAGLPMAERAADRDGLKLDQLHVQLGPVLRQWPAGLVLRLVVQGDVVQRADVELLGLDDRADPQPAFWDEPSRVAASHLDSAYRLLGVAGWAQGSVRAARLRDALLATGADLDRVAADVGAFARRVRRSRMLRWSLRDLGSLPADQAVGAGVSGPALRADGDAWDRLGVWLADAELALRDEQFSNAGPRGSVGERPPSAALLDVLPRLVTGCELAGVRLVVASLDPDLDQLVGSPIAVAGG